MNDEQEFHEGEHVPRISQLPLDNMILKNMAQLLI